MGFKNVLPIALAAALVAPGSAFADRKNGEKQGGERSEREYRDADRRARDGYYEGDYGRAYPGAYGNPGEYRRDKEWRQAEKDRRKAEREWLKDHREAEREWFKAEQEVQREWEKDRREAEREWEKDRREARKHGRHRDYPYDRRY
jgi:hypothetical protein